MKNLFQDPDKRNILIVTLLALVTRLIILPWSQTVHADAVSRVFIAVDWMANPHYITDGYWGPLHHYLNAFFMWIFPGRVIGPKMLNIILASATILPLYRFTLNVFGNRKGALFVALIYAFCPIIMRNSFQALAGVSYAFFVVLSMYFLSEGLKREGKLTFAALGGLAITCAAATRYEAWVVIAAFTLVLLLFRQWKYMIVFWLFAMIFPGSWMIGNQVEFGDFLYSVNQNDVWNIQQEGINDNVTVIERIKRVIFFPMSFLFNISPITVVLLLVGLIVAAVRKSFTKTQLIWLVPFLIMAGIFQQKAWAGTLMTQHRFVITWIILLLPFTALVFTQEKRLQLKTWLMTIAVVTLAPLSFFWAKIPYTVVLGENNFGKAVDELALASFREFEAIPLLQDENTEMLLAVINSNSKLDEGLLLDFFGWDKTYYLGLRAKNRAFTAAGAKHGENEYDLLNRYLAERPEGLVLFSQFGKLHGDATFRDSLVEINNIEHPLIIKELTTGPGVKLLRYKVVSADYAQNIKNQIPEPTGGLFSTERDIAFFEVLIKNDDSWFRGVKRGAFWKGQSLDSALRENAEYMVWIENQDN